MIKKICPICSCITSFIYQDSLTLQKFSACSTLHAYLYLNLPLENGEGRIRLEEYNKASDQTLYGREIPKVKKSFATV